MEYIHRHINKIEKSIFEDKDSIWEQYIDLNSMIDYQLVSEFSHNADAYTFSTFMYKDCDSKDGQLKFSLWDFDLGYGNYSAPGCSSTDTWVYENKDSCWNVMSGNKVYTQRLKQRWSQYRQNEYTDEHIEHVVDSLINLLTACGAEKRNAKAWDIWEATWKAGVKPQKYISSSYDEEIVYLKDWIVKRLKWMDEKLRVQ